MYFTVASVIFLVLDVFKFVIEQIIFSLLLKVYHSSKVFITSNNNNNNNNANINQDNTNTLDSDTPDHGTTFSLTTSDSGAESVWSRKASSQEDALAPTDVDDLSDDLPATPSVAKLIRHFSRCDSDSLYRSSTFTSTGSIYEDCNGKGVTPRLRSSNVHEVPFLLTTWRRRQRPRRGSFSSLVSTDSDSSNCRDLLNCSCGCSNACSPVGSYFTT